MALPTTRFRNFARKLVRRPFRRKSYQPRFDTLEDRTVPAPIPSTFAGNAQHTGIYDGPTPAQDMNAVHWLMSVDNNVSFPANYGTPLVSANNTVFIPVKTTASGGFEINAIDGTNPTLVPGPLPNTFSPLPKYTLSTGYLAPPFSTMPSYSPAIATGPSG